MSMIDTLRARATSKLLQGLDASGNQNRQAIQDILGPFPSQGDAPANKPADTPVSTVPDPNSEGANGGVVGPSKNQYGGSANLDSNYLLSQIRADAQRQGLTLTPEREQYWLSKASTPDLYSDNQWRVGWNPYWASKLGGAASSDPSLAGSEGILQGYGGGASGGGNSGQVFSDPATSEWEGLLRQLVQRMQQPQPTWTPAQLELQQTQVLDPLERQRQQQKQQTQVHLASRGITPGSGIYDDAMSKIDQQFNQLRTTTQSGIANQAINREDQLFNNNESRSANAVNMFKQIPQLADTRLATAQGTIQNPTSLIQLLMSQQQNNQNTSAYNNAQNQQFWANLAQSLQGLFT